MKIAQIVCTFPPYRGGTGNTVYNISESLADLGHEVTVFTPNYHYKNEDEFHEGKFKIERLEPIFKYGNAAFIPQLFWKLKNFDIIHLHYPFYGAIKPILLKKLLSGRKMKLILHYHMDSRAQGFKGAVFYFYNILILPFLIMAAQIITCASLDYVKHSDLKKYYQARPDKFRQIFFGVNLEQFVTCHDNQNKQRQNKVILFVGSLDKAHYFKGLENLLKAFAIVIKNSELSSTVLKVVGQGDLLPYYKDCAFNLGLGENVKFYENADNNKLVDFYNYSDCLVLPSINKGEAFGLVLLEAMSCSTPVIASNLPGVRSVFKNGIQGLLVQPGDINDLADKIKIILNNKKLAQNMGLAGRKLVESKYTWDKVAKRLDSIYYENLFNK
ncbi:glycosyltransferase family 4 protein [Patescibacteria group bacterium]|nr:glycosyltransferase family 4 protein [Patescibacteria group bacterium]MBU1663378.1 glycosyltransferase family 4 protein [Patescibacteria group bacterium]MBU1934333.1 glycosyltransferase family 4 protein [Patescibacteria group bacterium]